MKLGQMMDVIGLPEGSGELWMEVEELNDKVCTFVYLYP